MKTEMIEYRGYELQITHNPPMWQVGIYPTKPTMLAPLPDLQIVSLGNKDDAIAEARRRVDMLISS
jgi:hypothetical protein